MNTQIDERLEKLITLEKINAKDIQIYLGKMPENLEELLSILKNIRKHIRTYGRKSNSLEVYIKETKERINRNSSQHT